MNDERRSRWEDASEVPLTLMALAFLGAYAWPILVPDLGEPWRPLCVWVAWLTWAAFAVDYLVRLRLAEDRSGFFRGHLPDLAMVVLPVLRPLRLLRLVMLLKMLNRHAGSSLRGRVAAYVSGAAGLLVLLASLAVLDAERGEPGANIASFGDAIWWAMTTVTTVGYGDQFPVTTTGRFVAAGLMLAGIALLGVVTASFASWLIERVAEIEEESEAATRRDVLALTVEVEALRRQLQDQATQDREG
jgi:voltage-gated potassium channel